MTKHRHVCAQVFLAGPRWAARAAALLLGALVLAQAASAAAAEVLKVGSKRFTESYILGELLLQGLFDLIDRSTDPRRKP